MDDTNVKTLAETEQYAIWTDEESDGEKTYHLELGDVTIHFIAEDWTELLQLMKKVIR